MEILAATAVFLLALAAIAVMARQPAPRARSRARRGPARPRKSVLVTAAKAAGVKVGSDQLSHATAELAGKAAGGTARGTGRLTRWGGRWLGRAGLAAGRWTERHADSRWQARTAGAAAVPVLWRQHGAAPDQPGDSPATPAGPAPGPPDNTSPPDSTGPAPPPPAGPATTTAPDGAPAAPKGAERNTTIMRHRYAINLERPGTDAEFLESCVQLGDVLKALAEEVSDWADSLSGLNLPQSVLAPLHLVSEGIEEAASGASQSAKAFEDEFEDARDVASRGMHFTGEDAA